MDKMIKITNFMHKISFAAVNNTTKPKRRIVMKKVLALVLSLVLMHGGSAAALAETAQSIPPLSQISSNPNSATFTWRSDVSTQDVEKKEISFVQTGISKASSTSVVSRVMRKKVSRQRKKRVVMQWRNRREQPPGASCSCISCCPTECLRHGAGERRRALGRNCRQGRHPRPGCAYGSRG